MLRRDELMPPDVGFGIRRHDDSVQIFADLHNSSFLLQAHSGFFQGAFQRKLPLTGQLVDLGDLCGRDIVMIDSADPFSFFMDVEHDPRRLRRRFMEDGDEDFDHEIHRRVVVVVKDHPVETSVPGSPVRLSRPLPAGCSVRVSSFSSIHVFYVTP